MNSSSSSIVATIVSTALIAFGTKKLLENMGSKVECLDSLCKSSLQSSERAYPEDYYPGGEYASLSKGDTHYFLFGPENGKKVVFVHGLSSPASVFNKVARHMAENGCRVLLYDLYSRGYSVGPVVNHDPALYVEQLHDLLVHVGWDKCNFVGYSLGGAIVACHSRKFPDTIESLTFIAPGGLLNSSDMPLVAKIFSVPYAVEILSREPIKSYFSKKNVESMVGEFKDGIPKSIEEAVKIMELQFKHHAGYARGIMSTLKSFPLTGLQDTFESFEQKSFPIQLIWGDKDTVIPESTATAFQQLVPRAKTTIVKGATHSIVLTHDSVIIEALSDFF